MVLSISYFSKVKIREIGEEEADEYYVENNKYFMYQLGSLKNGQSLDKTPESESGSFYAGSYSGYGVWRKHLLELLGYGSLEKIYDDFKPNVRLMKLN